MEDEDALLVSGDVENSSVARRERFLIGNMERQPSDTSAFHLEIQRRLGWTFQHFVDDHVYSRNDEAVAELVYAPEGLDFSDTTHDDALCTGGAFGKRHDHRILSRERGHTDAGKCKRHLQRSDLRR
jgi:hypothetical protein